MSDAARPIVIARRPTVDRGRIEKKGARRERAAAERAHRKKSPSRKNKSFIARRAERAGGGPRARLPSENFVLFSVLYTRAARPGARYHPAPHLSYKTFGRKIPTNASLIIRGLMRICHV